MEKMNVLVVGSGGREHALCWKIQKSPLVNKVFVAPGNAGMRNVAECVPLAVEDKGKVVAFCNDKNIKLVVIGPEAPLAMGLADTLNENNIACFGPTKAAAQLESSKGFTKQLCDRMNIPTAKYGFFDKSHVKEAKAFIDKMPAGEKIVVKADGLAAGKGVVICDSKADACCALDDMLGGKLGTAGTTVVIEEFLDGEEASFYALCDGETAMYVGSAQDHKAVGDGDTGPNTGGMGAYVPPPIITDKMRDRVMSEIILPTVQGMKKMNIPFKGVLFAGLMIRKRDQQPMLLEYNVRFGDPETQPLMMKMASDIVPLLMAVAKGTLKSQQPPVFSSGAAVCVVMAAKGYPNAYKKGSEIRNIDAAERTGATVFHAGTSLDAATGKLIATGGRVLGVTALDGTVSGAQKRAYAAVDQIQWEDGFCRRDIAYRAVNLERRQQVTTTVLNVGVVLGVVALAGALVGFALRNKRN